MSCIIKSDDITRTVYKNIGDGKLPTPIPGLDELVNYIKSPGENICFARTNTSFLLREYLIDPLLEDKLNQSDLSVQELSNCYPNGLGPGTVDTSSYLRHTHHGLPVFDVLKGDIVTTLGLNSVLSYSKSSLVRGKANTYIENLTFFFYKNWHP